MDKTELSKLFKLLGCYYPNAKQLRDKDLQYAWLLALEPFPYDTIRTAAIQHVRKQNFFPDVTDLTKLVPMVQEEEKKAAESVTWRFDRQPLYAKACKILGLDPWYVAKANGLTLDEWSAAYEEIKKQLPPTYAALKRQGFTYAEQVQRVDQAWSDFWEAHGEPDHGTP